MRSFFQMVSFFLSIRQRLGGILIYDSSKAKHKKPLLPPCPLPPPLSFQFYSILHKFIFIRIHVLMWSSLQGVHPPPAHDTSSWKKICFVEAERDVYLLTWDVCIILSSITALDRNDVRKWHFTKHTKKFTQTRMFFRSLWLTRLPFFILASSRKRSDILSSISLTVLLRYSMAPPSITPTAYAVQHERGIIFANKISIKRGGDRHCGKWLGTLRQNFCDVVDIN